MKSKEPIWGFKGIKNKSLKFKRITCQHCNYSAHFFMQNYALISKHWFQQKTIGLFVSDIAIVSDQSFAGLCERSGKLSEPPKGSVLKPAMVIKKLILPVAGSFCRFRTG
ncbi:hypothetical protein [Desulfobotulus mexicanus]|nr:hypothetical protein [Desulfobotulus mexicanus]